MSILIEHNAHEFEEWGKERLKSAFEEAGGQVERPFSGRLFRYLTVRGLDYSQVKKISSSLPCKYLGPVVIDETPSSDAPNYGHNSRNFKQPLCELSPAY